MRTGPQAAYLLSGPTRAQGSNEYYATMWATSNGGTSWAARPVPCHIGAMAASLSVAPDGTLFVVCSGEPSAGFQPKSVLRSADGGLDWVVEVDCVLVPKPSPGCSSDVNGGYLAGITAVSSSTVFLFGGRSSLLVSRDAGAEWGLVHPFIGDSGGSSGPVLSFNRNEAVALGSNPRSDEAPTIWATFDGGVRWKALVPHIAQGP